MYAPTEELTRIAESSRDAVTAALNTWAEAAQRYAADFDAKHPVPDAAETQAAVDTAFDLAGKLLAEQHAFASTVVAANSTPIALAQVCARSRRVGLPRLCARHSVNTTIVGNAIPKHENTMCQPSDSAICIRAGNRFSAAPASTSAWSTRPAWSGDRRGGAASRPAEPPCLT